MIWRHYLLLLWIYYVGLLINDVVLFWLYQEILKEHMYNSSLVSKFILRKVGGKLFSMRSPNLWYPWQQSTGQNSSTQNTTLLALAELGWERSPWQPAQQGEGPPYLESSSTSLIHPANVHIWKHVGPGVESWWRQSLPMTQRSEGRRVFWYVKIKRKEVLPETERIKIRKKMHPYNYWKMRKTLLRKPATRLGVWKLQGQQGGAVEEGQNKGSKPVLLPKIF